MLDTALLTGLNHLLAGSNWARARLIPFAGRHARFEIPPIALAFAVNAEGHLDPATDDGAPDVTIQLPANAAFLLPQGLDKLMAVARVEGNAEFATELSFVFRNLRWDIEEDLSRVVGDIAAHRLVQGAGQLAGWKKDAAARFAANLAEYLAHERAAVVAQPEFQAFRIDLAKLTDDLARIESRFKTIP